MKTAFRFDDKLVAKCCRNCQHSDYDSRGELCVLNGQKRNPLDLCDSYEFDEIKYNE